MDIKKYNICIVFVICTSQKSIKPYVQVSVDTSKDPSAQVPKRDVFNWTLYYDILITWYFDPPL